MHNKPAISQTILIQGLYLNPVLNAPLGPDGQPQAIDERLAHEEFEVGLSIWGLPLKTGSGGRMAGLHAASVRCICRMSAPPACGTFTPQGCTSKQQQGACGSTHPHPTQPNPNPNPPHL